MATSLPATLRTLAVVQAGGAGSRMEVLTQERAKPAMPVAGTHRLIDFPLSVLVASNISDVWVSVQFQSGTLDTYLAGGRPWDLDRTRGGFRRLTPEQGSGSPDEDGFSQGNADGLFRIRDDIRAFAPDVLLVLSADHLFNVDLRPVISRHLDRGAECTLLTAEVGVQEATHQVVVSAGADGRVRAVRPKPSSTDIGTVASEIVLYDPDVLIEALDRLHAQLQADGADTGLGDFAEHLLPALVGRGQVYAEPLPGYWKDLGRPEAYLQAHRDLLAGRVDVFSHADRPIRSGTTEGPAAWFGDEAEVRDAMVAPRSRVRGSVRRSVLGPGVEVQAGAVVEDSVLLGDTVVEAGAIIRTAIVDTGVRVGRGARVGDAPAGTRLTDEAITLIGQDCTIRRGAVVPAGARLDPGATADQT
ncbi:glucose-1-phosphate adenylyltransferase family protein [Pseudactinotalea terrae]|uniref:glucose-1-phosphate adenylyltransferase family protein n=1 Tax=Pseudactinotalea terrae TaxID=1743262 RepID=UPI0019D5A87B|nr:sugar phosphate nucleotidyltransferase [Pseudactinotalea terrae]